MVLVVTCVIFLLLFRELCDNPFAMESLRLCGSDLCHEILGMIYEILIIKLILKIYSVRTAPCNDEDQLLGI